MTDYEQAYRDLRAGVEALAARHSNEGPGEWSGREHVCGECGHDWPCADRQAIDAILASSTPATASEDATLSDSVTDSVTSSDGDRGLSAILNADGWEGVEVDDLIERAVEAIAWGLLEATSDTADREPSREAYDDAQATAKRILAARTAQSEGVERVEWGVRYGDGEIDSTVTYSGDTGAWAYGDRASAEATIANARRSIEEDPSCAEDYEPMDLVRRTVATYAPVVSEWEVVGDE